MRTPTIVGKDLVWCCWNESVLGKEPKALYVDARVVSTTSPESCEVWKQKTLWNGSLKVAGVKEGDTVLMNWT